MPLDEPKVVGAFRLTTVRYRQRFFRVYVPHLDNLERCVWAKVGQDKWPARNFLDVLVVDVQCARWGWARNTANPFTAPTLGLGLASIGRTPYWEQAQQLAKFQRGNRCAINGHGVARSAVISSEAQPLRFWDAINDGSLLTTMRQDLKYMLKENCISLCIRKEPGSSRTCAIQGMQAGYSAS